MGVSVQEYRARIGSFQHGDFMSRNRKSKAFVLQGSSCTFSGLFPSILICGILLIISGIEQNPGPDYACKVCSFVSTSVECYFQHHQDKHAPIPCMVSECSFQTSSLGLLQSHVTVHHPRRNLMNKEAFSCPVPACGIPHGNSSLKEHLLKHLAAGQEFVCPFGEKCNVLHKKEVCFKTHVSQCHQALVSLPGSSTSDGCRNQPSAALSPSPSPSSASGGFMLAPNVMKDEVLKFYLELEGPKVLPSSTVQLISERIANFLKMSHSSLTRNLVTELHNLKFDVPLIRSIVSKTLDNDPIFNVHHKGRSFEQVTTIRLRRKALKERLSYIPSTEVQLPNGPGGKRRVAQYVPIKSVLTVLLNDTEIRKEVLKSFSRQQEPANGILEDFYHGTSFAEHLRHQCIQLIFFQDAFEYSPFGPAKGLYKTVGMYFILGNLPSYYRSRVESIILAFLIQEQYLKQSEREHLDSINKFEESFYCLIKDLQELNTNGISVGGLRYPVCVIYFTGGNLGQHQIGSYVQSFSSDYCCRYCPMSMEEFRKDPSLCKNLRTNQDYDNCVALAKRKWDALKIKALKIQKKKRTVEAQKLAAGKEVKKRVSKTRVSKNFLQQLQSVHHLGIKPMPSALNKIPGFHVNLSLAPCIAHDLFEGCVSTILAKILEHFVETKQWFDLKTLNNRITTFKYKNQDANDAPCEIKSFDGIKSHAVETWTLLRLLPFMIFDLIEDVEDEYWQLYLQLKEICEYVCSPKISLKQVSYMRTLILAFLCGVKRLLPDCLTPKTHYLQHFPDLCILFGPLIYLFTLRFESRHCFFKEVAIQSKSFKNITLTLAQKYQYLFAYENLNGFLPPAVVIECTPEEVLLSVLKESTSCELPHCEAKTVKVVFEVTIKNTLYKNNMWLLLSKVGEIDLETGRIVKIVIYPGDEIFFVVETHVARSSGNGYYIISPSNTGVKVIKSDLIPDYYPLSAYRVNSDDFCLSLKHAPVFL